MKTSAQNFSAETEFCKIDPWSRARLYNVDFLALSNDPSITTVTEMRQSRILRPVF
jgi:hypothetical protein